MIRAAELEPTELRLARMPKVELHVHVEGAMHADTIFEMSERNQIPLPAKSKEKWREFYEFRDFAHFVEVYLAAAKTMITPEDWIFMVEHFYASQAAQNIIYTEAFISATLALSRFAPNTLLDAIAEGVRRSEAKHNIRVRFIPDIARQEPSSQTAVLEFATLGFQRGLFLGIGLGGPEIGHPPEGFAPTYAEAKRRGLRLVAHAGETVGPASVRGAIDALGAERIGHGVRSLEDPALIRELRQSQIPLEVCPTSNDCLSVTKRGEHHPIRALVDAGVRCTLNSDDPTMFGTTLNLEYARLCREGFSFEELVQLNRNAIDVSFAKEAEKKRLREALDLFLSTT